MDTTDPNYVKAKKRVQDEKGFFIHFFIYIFVNIIMLVLNLLTAPNTYWFQWTTFGWGIGLAAHGMVVFIFNKSFGEDWEERRIHKMMEREANQDEKNK